MLWEKNAFPKSEGNKIVGLADVLVYLCRCLSIHRDHQNFVISKI